MFKNKHYSFNQNTTYIPSSTIIEADLIVEDIIIHGVLNGDITAKNKLILGSSGSIKGNIIAKNIYIYGKCCGDLQIKNNLFVGETAEILGNISANSVTSESGSIIKGYIKVNKEKANKIYNIKNIQAS